MQPRSHVYLVLIGLGVTICAGPAWAQSSVAHAADTETVVSDPSLIGQCLCEAQAVSSRFDALRSAETQYDDAKNHAEATQREVDALRPKVDPTSAEMLDAYRRLLVESERAKAILYSQAQPDDAKAVTRYNQAVATYNADCAGQRFDANRRAQVAQTLICPVP